jgi:RimJ/RimL family protein N-acetyltransferase
VKVKFEDIETLRTWRNSDYVNQRMVINEYITKEMQEKWFESINNEFNYYFIGEYNNEKVGVISIKNINNNSGEGAIYLASEKYENTSVVARIVLCFNDFIFDELKLDFIYSHVKRDNKKAITSTFAQGGIEEVDKSNLEYIHFRLYKENYINKTQKIRKILNTIQ